MKAASQLVRAFGPLTVLSSTLLYSQLTIAHSKLDRSIPNDKDVIETFGLSSQISLPKRINILVWNLHKGSNDDFATDFVSLGLQKDLVISQEMYLNPLMRLVFSSFPYYFYSTATSFCFGKELTRTGVSTSGPVLPTKIEFIRTQTVEPITNSPKVTLITRYPIRFTSKELTVVNIHGINFVGGDSYRKEMNRIYESLKNVPSPIIFAGDFNSWSDERNTILKEMIQKLGLKETGFSPDYRLKFNKHPLDHFYYTSDIKIVSAKVEEFYQGSDHKPLEVIVEYSPQTTLAKSH
ncbi:MAG: endonuclease/exonuclease/phosphatase family protein [Bacteriovorax sp.]|nr:endonuclease/exonuclease/phosphatase family protein [Bacteriovorax sp.]